MQGSPAESACPTAQFVDVTDAAGIDFVGAYGLGWVNEGPPLPTMQANMGNGVAVGDYDSDGDLDLYLLGNLGSSNKLYRNNLIRSEGPESKTFTDVTPAGLGQLGLSRMAHFVDLDDDGDPDLVVINDDSGVDADGTGLESHAWLFRNDGDGVFADVTDGSGFRPGGYLRAGSAIADYDRDGLLDIYVTVWTAEGGGGSAIFPGSNRLYRNLGGFQFQDVTDDVGLGGLARDSFAAIFTDFDGDHDPDLFVAVDHTSDEFYFNDEGVFRNETARVGATHVANDMGIAVADFDDDDDLDMYVTNITEDFGDGPPEDLLETNVLLVNQHDTGAGVEFLDEAVQRGAYNSYWGWGTEFVDIENDGDLDLLAANGFDQFMDITFGNLGQPIETFTTVYQKPTVLFCNDGSGSFIRNDQTVLEDHPDDSRALVAFDYDRDGDRDVLVTNVAQKTRLFENRSQSQGHWLHLSLGPDRYAVGATARATLDPGDGSDVIVKRRDVILGRSYLTGSPSELHFGLGDFEEIASLEIEWANGYTEVLSEVAVDQMLTLLYAPEPGGPALAAAAMLALATLTRSRAPRKQS
jgi:hypothetical protein